jgi:hypothetical protein
MSNEPMLILYAFCAIPFVILGVICFVMVGKVREGRYKNSFLGDAPIEGPKPEAAVALVMAPFATIIPWHLLRSRSTGRLRRF